MRKRILWVSKHPPLYKQVEELKRIYGDVEIVQYAGFVKDARHVLDLKEKCKADEVVTVLPLSMIMRIIDLGIKPLWAEMEQINGEDYDFEDPGSGRRYRFKRFVRIVRFEMVKEEVG